MFREFYRLLFSFFQNNVFTSCGIISNIVVNFFDPSNNPHINLIILFFLIIFIITYQYLSINLIQKNILIFDHLQTFRIFQAWKFTCQEIQVVMYGNLLCFTVFLLLKFLFRSENFEKEYFLYLIWIHRDNILYYRTIQLILMRSCFKLYFLCVLFNYNQNETQLVENLVILIYHAIQIIFFIYIICDLNIL